MASRPTTPAHAIILGANGAVGAYLARLLQALFDRGHAAEASARTILERMIEQELYPVTASNGRLLASYDLPRYAPPRVAPVAAGHPPARWCSCAACRVARGAA